MTHADGLESHALFGVDHPDFGRVALEHVGPSGRSALALSAGSDSLQGARGAKLEMKIPNEDAVLVVEQDDRTLLAVADAHFGHSASHVLLARLKQATESRRVPRSPLELLSMLPGLVDESPSPQEPSVRSEDRSATTLLIAVIERPPLSVDILGTSGGRGFAISVGDSALFVVPAAGPARRLDRPEDRYATPRRPESLDPRSPREYAFEVDTGDFVVVCTDGVHECCYKRPELSIGAQHLQEHRLRNDPIGDCAPGDFTESLIQQALEGVDGHPGGQDNIALAVTRC